MRLASYNVENLFDRAKAMNLDSWSEGKPTLAKFAELNALLGEVSYTAAAKTRMVKLFGDLGLTKSDKGPFVILRRNRGRLVKRPRSGGLEITASGRADWVGSLELIPEPVDNVAMRNTARVMADIEADVLGVVEVESRPVLYDFSRLILPAVDGKPFAHVMLIDGNDARGIDVGIVSRDGFPIGEMRSHVDDAANGRRIFSRDCAEYEVATPEGNRLLVLVNHFKSKGYGSAAANNARRKAQAGRVAAIYRERIQGGTDYLAVIGDFNDSPDSAPLKPLVRDTDLKDAFVHPAFDDGGYPGTFGSCTKRNKIDYLLLSPKLYAKVVAGGVFRKGMWPGTRPVKWDAYQEIKKPVQAASDHAAVWVDLDI